jgi:hypothetical protein
MRTLINFFLCLLVVTAITVACVLSANSASKVRFERKIQTLNAYNDARSRYSMHPRFIFDEIDFRNNQWDKKSAAVAEYEDSFIDAAGTLRILEYAAGVLAAAFMVNHIVRSFPLK